MEIILPPAQHKYVKELQKAVHIMNSVSDQPESAWEHNTPASDIPYHDKLSFRRLAVKNHPTGLVVGQGVFDKFTIFEWVAACKSPGMRRIWDKDVESMDVIESILGSTFVLHVKHEARWPISPRDSVLVASAFWDCDGKRFVSVATSVNDERCPEEKGFVRIAVDLAGWIFEPLDGSDMTGPVKVTSFHQTDVKPSALIPKPFLRSLAFSFPRAISRVNNIFTYS